MRLNIHRKKLISQFLGSVVVVENKKFSNTRIKSDPCYLRERYQRHVNYQRENQERSFIDSSHDFATHFILEIYPSRLVT